MTAVEVPVTASGSRHLIPALVEGGAGWANRRAQATTKRKPEKSLARFMGEGLATSIETIKRIESSREAPNHKFQHGRARKALEFGAWNLELRYRRHIPSPIRWER